MTEKKLIELLIENGATPEEVQACLLIRHDSFMWQLGQVIKKLGIAAFYLSGAVFVVAAGEALIKAVQGHKSENKQPTTGD